MCEVEESGYSSLEREDLCVSVLPGVSLALSPGLMLYGTDTMTQGLVCVTGPYRLVWE